VQKIISLFQRNYDGDRLIRDGVVPGAEAIGPNLLYRGDR